MLKGTDADINKQIIKDVKWQKEIEYELKERFLKESEHELRYWIELTEECECPNCGEKWDYCDNDTERFKHCPNCGIRLLDREAE